MTWISIVFYILMHIPDLIAIIKKILELIHNAPREAGESLRQKVADAIEQHKADKDGEKLKKALESCAHAPEILKA